jgi:ABC-2 type transport system permease protein
MTQLSTAESLDPGPGPEHPDGSVWRQVARREIAVRTRGKTFWVSSALTIVIILAGVLALHFLSGRTTTYRVGASSGGAAELVAAAPAARGERFVTTRYTDAEAADSALRAGKVDAVLVPPSGADGSWTLRGKTDVDPVLQGALARAVAAAALTRNAQALHVAPAALVAGSQLVTATLESGEQDQTFQYGVTFGFGLLFFLSCQLFGTTVANSVVEEKESRVVEVILAATSTRALLTGKVIGNAVLGIVQMAVFAAVALLTAELTGGVSHLGAIARSSTWFLLFYVLGFGTVCCLFAGLGALASRAQDVQAATAPVQLIITATYLCAVLGKGAVLTVASYLPVASTVAMPARLFAGGVPWWQVALALAVALAFAAVSVVVAARAYRSSVLHTGGRLSLKASLSGQVGAGRDRAETVVA